MGDWRLQGCIDKLNGNYKLSLRTDACTSNKKFCALASKIQLVPNGPLWIVVREIRLESEGQGDDGSWMGRGVCEWNGKAGGLQVCFRCGEGLPFIMGVEFALLDCCL